MGIDVPSTWHNIPVAALNGLLDIHREVIQAIDLESISYAAQHEQHLHVDGRAVGSNGPRHVM